MDEVNSPDTSTERARGLGGALLDDAALDDLLQKVVLLACRTVPPADSVSITVADGAGYRTSNSTDNEALAIDRAQYAGGDGPCLQALRTGRQVQVAVGNLGGRWPAFEEKASAEGVGAVLSTPLMRTPSSAIGALNIYSHDAAGFDESSRLTAEVIAEHAAILAGNTLDLLTAAQLNEQLRQALASREIIGEAKGIIMERQSCTRDEAFDVLRRASQRENRKLRDLAEELVLRVEARKRDERSLR
ncbi:MAG TPA: ANTAR domain-containing protein [Acidimicrobiales bacterium]|nr:ANTAR domain-containing protein [Acidimicrobiales bacterium]